MKIIDANTGIEVKIGVPFDNVDGRLMLIEVDESLFSARALFTVNDTYTWVPLVVRYTHPGFFLQKVGFIPS